MNYISTYSLMPLHYHYNY